MRSHILLLFLLRVFLPASCSEQNTDQAYRGTGPSLVDQAAHTAPTVGIGRTAPTRSTLYPHTVGIQNPKSNCYMNALFACLYGNPFFQNSVYEAIDEIPVEELPMKSESVLLSLGDLFVKMRLDSRPVNLKPTMFAAIKSAFNWKVGEYECVLEFWGQMVANMPESFNQIFKSKIKTNYHRKSDDRLIKSIPDEYCYINIPAPHTLVSLSKIIDEKFVDREAEDYGIIPDDQHEYQHILDGPIDQRVDIPVYSTVEFVNAPNVLVFGIKRLGWNRSTEEQEFNDTAINFDAITVRGEIYRPCGSIIFDSSISHYFALHSDFESNSVFIQNDTRLTEIEIDGNARPEDRSFLSNSISKNSVMVFYVKVSAANELKRSGSVRKIMNDEDISPVLLKERAELASQAQAELLKKLFPIPPKKNRASPLGESCRKKAKIASLSDTSEAEIIHGTTDDIDDGITLDDGKTDHHDEINNVSAEDDDEIHSILSDAFLKYFEEADSSAAETSEIAEESKVIEIISKSSSANSVNPSSSTPQPDLELDNSLLDALIEEVSKEVDSDLRYMHERAKRLESEMGERTTGFNGAEANYYIYTASTMNTLNAMQQERIESPAPVLEYNFGQSSLYSRIPSKSKAAPCFNSPPIKYAPQGFTYALPPAQQQMPQKSVTQAQSQSQSPTKLTLSQLSQEEQEHAKSIFRTHSDKFTEKEKLYQLGTEEFSFSEDSRYLPLEMILTAFATNSSFLFTLFEVIKTHPLQCDLEKYLAIILIQMLIGCKNIDINSLKKQLIDAEFKTKISNNSSPSFEKQVTSCLNFFSKKLANALMEYPTTKTILFSELDTDEPIRIAHIRPDLPVFDPQKTIISRPGNFSGVFIDTNHCGNRLRHLITAPISVFFPIITPRCKIIGEFVSESINPSSSDHVFLGCIKYGPPDNLFEYSAQFISNYSAQTFVAYDFESGVKITKHSTDDFLAKSNAMTSEFHTRSYVMFVIRTSKVQENPVRIPQIPLELVQLVMKKIKIDTLALASLIRTLKAQPDPSSSSTQPEWADSLSLTDS